MLTNVWALFVNPTFVWGYAHVILASLVTGCLVMLAVSAWYLRKQRHVESFHRTAKVALIVLIPAIVDPDFRSATSSVRSRRATSR